MSTFEVTIERRRGDHRGMFIALGLGEPPEGEWVWMVAHPDHVPHGVGCVASRDDAVCAAADALAATRFTGGTA